MTRSFSFLLAVILWACTAAYCQDQHIVIIKGTVVNSVTGTAVSYATVSLTVNGIKTFSNEEGKFILKIPAANVNDSLYLSHIGYRPVSMRFHLSDTNQLVVKLEEEAQTLQDVVIEAINPLALIRKAIARIPDNYAVKPFQVNAFYRLTGQKEKRVVDLSEAVLETYNENYTNRNKQFKVVKARLDKDLTAFGGMDGIEFGAKPEDMMEADVVSNAGKSGLLSEDGLRDHVFTYDGKVDYNGREAYVISYDQKDGIKKSLDKGVLYIDTKNLAFLRVNVWKSPKGIQYWDFGFKQRILLKLVSLRARLLQDSGYITYEQYGDKYYVSHVFGTARWYIAGGRNQFELNPLHIKLNYIITGIDTGSVASFKKEQVQHNSRMVESQAPDTNTDSTDAFWGIYNLLQADFNVDSAAKIIRANNETLNYKKMLTRQMEKYRKATAAEKIDSILSFYYNKKQFNGAALVKYQGNVIYQKGFGMADKTRHLPNTPQTQFRIGSTSKQFTAMLIMQLVNEGKINVEDSAGKFLPAFKNGRVTIRQLLTHQSGIPNYLQNEAYTAEILMKNYTTDELVKQFCSDSLEFEPGTQMKYSNSGFVVLADIIEKVTGKPYSDVLAEKIFKPIGMTHSYFDKKANDTTLLATGYVFEEPEMPYPVRNEVGAGGITSTAEDLLRWHNALSANTLLPEDKMKELFKPRVAWDEWDAYYGYGWMIDRLQFEASKKHTIQYHPGTEIGFYDMLVRQPDKDIFIIILNNKGDFPRFDMTDLILNILN